MGQNPVLGGSWVSEEGGYILARGFSEKSFIDWTRGP